MWSSSRALFFALVGLCGCASSGAAGGSDLGVLGQGGSEDAARPAAGPDGGDDAGPPAPLSLAIAVPCVDAADAIYVTPTGLPTLDALTQGDPVRCRHDVDEDADGPGVDALLAGNGISLPAPSSGVQIYRISFRTFRANGTPAASTARVYLPTQPRALPLPLVVAAHPTVGMGDSCAPSRDPTSLREVALPWAASGFAVIAPDYAGFGNEGVEAYLNNRDQAQSLLDGARALRKLIAAGAFTDQIVISGFSQGGGAALSAQAIAKSYGAGGTVAAVVAFAPEWPIRDNSFAFADMVRNPSALVAYDLGNQNLSYSNHVIWTQRALGYFAGFSQLTSNGGAAFPAAVAGSFESNMDTLCGEVAIGAAIYVAARAPFGATNGDLFDPTFRASLAACLDSASDPACTGLGKDFYTYMTNNRLDADPAGAPILYVQGLADTVLPPAKEAACIVKKLAADGIAPQLCVDATAQHTDVTNRNTAFAIQWAEAVLARNSLPACPSSAQLPNADCN
jgi:dienelactone hydrolase